MSIESVIEVEYANAVDARLESLEAYIEYQRQEAERALPFLARFFEPQGAHVLEIGAGRGGKGIAYAQAGMRAVSLDVDVEALRVGMRCGVAFRCGNKFFGGRWRALAVSGGCVRCHLVG